MPKISLKNITILFTGSFALFLSVLGFIYLNYDYHYAVPDKSLSELGLAISEIQKESLKKEKVIARSISSEQSSDREEEEFLYDDFLDKSDELHRLISKEIQGKGGSISAYYRKKINQWSEEKNININSEIKVILRNGNFSKFKEEEFFLIKKLDLHNEEDCKILEGFLNSLWRNKEIYAQKDFYQSASQMLFTLTLLSPQPNKDLLNEILENVSETERDKLIQLVKIHRSDFLIELQ